MFQNKLIKQRKFSKKCIFIFSAIFILFFVIPCIILSTSSNIIVKFFVYTIIYTSMTVIAGLFVIVNLLSTRIEYSGVYDFRERFKFSWNTLFVVFCLFIVIFSADTSINYCKDIPNVIHENYSYYTGTLLFAKPTYTKAISTDLYFSDRHFKVNGIVDCNLTTLKTKYYITYLSNSGYVISVKKEMLL